MRPSSEPARVPPVSFVVLAPAGLDARTRVSLASARAQDYPQFEPEIIFVRSLEEAAEQATGELVALLRAGETWLPGKTSAQVALLAGRPEVGLVYGDSDPSLFLHLPPQRGRALGHLLTGPLAPPSSILVRAPILRAALDPDLIAPCQFWWLTLRAAELSELDFLPRAVCTIDTALPDSSAFRRALLARVSPGTVPSPLLLEALDLLPALAPLGSSTTPRETGIRLAAVDHTELATAYLVRALAIDPTDGEAAAALAHLARPAAA